MLKGANMLKKAGVPFSAYFMTGFPGETDDDVRQTIDFAKKIETQRKEADRHQEKSWFSKLISRPEIGPIGVMLLLFGMLGYFSIPAGEMSWNPFTGEGFNALGKEIF